MSEPRPPWLPTGDAASPGERRLLTLLDLLRREPIGPDPSLADAVVRAARWQGPARRLLTAAGVFGEAFAHTLAALTGLGGRRSGGLR
jgi:hypothetical protein